MSTIIVAAILIGFIAIFCWLLMSIHHSQKRKHMNQLINRFSKIGSENNMTFSSQEILKDCILGLDGINKKLLILKNKDKNSFTSTIIDLKEVKICSVKKQYGAIAGGALQNNKIETYLENILLHFERENASPVEVVFYNYIENYNSEISDLTQKATHWETILNKMLKPQLKKIA
jgi:hypothetical protein